MDLILSGAVHILLAAPEEGQAVTLALGELTLETSRAHLFYNGWARPARLIVVSGEVKLTGIVAVIPGPEGAKDPTAALKEGDALALHPDAPALEEPTENDERLRRWAELPGFQVPGPYKRVGVALPSDERLAVVRYGREAVLSGKAIALMEGDEVLSRAPQNVLIRFDNGDRVKLFGDTTFHIERHLTAKKAKENLLFRLFGKMRALLIARTQPADIRVNTVTAVIGVKGTDFEALAGTADTEVSVVDGLLGVTDPVGRGAVDVPAGMFTTVLAGQLPTPPAPIPPEKLEQLRAEAITAESVSILSPAEGEVLRSADIAYRVAPPGAPVEVLLDGETIEAPSGTPLPALSDGQHRLTVKAAQSDEPVQTVTFTLDNKPPVPAAGVELAALTFVPGEPVVLSWNEPLDTLEVTSGEQAIPSELSEDGSQARLAPDAALFQPDIPLPVRIRAVDRAGNETVLEGALLLLPAPKPPTVTLGTGDPEFRGERLGDLKATADREIVKWTVILDELDVTEKALPPGPERPPVKEIMLPASLFASLKPGRHILTVKAADIKEQEGTASLRITLLPPAAPEPKPAAEPAPGRPAKSLRERYEGTIAGDTGYPLDEMYLNSRGPFFSTPGFKQRKPEEPPRTGLYPALPPYQAGFLRAMEDPFFRRHSVAAEEGTPVPR